MGRGVDFFDGMEPCKNFDINTQPSAPKQSAGPVVGPKGVDNWQAHSNTKDSQKYTGTPSSSNGLGSKWVSPTSM